MNIRKVVVTISLSLAMIFSSCGSGFAAIMDLHHESDITKNVRFSELFRMPSKFLMVAKNIDKYYMEGYDNKYYLASEVDQKTKDNKKSFDEAIGELKPYIKSDSSEFEQIVGNILNIKLEEKLLLDNSLWQSYDKLKNELLELKDKKYIRLDLLNEKVEKIKKVIDEINNPENIDYSIRITSLIQPPTLFYKVGDEIILPEKVNALMSDGSRKGFDVQWNISDRDTSKPKNIEANSTIDGKEVTQRIVITDKENFINKSKLVEAIRNAQKIGKIKYSEPSFRELSEALTYGIQINENQTSTFEEIEEATNRILDAIINLVDEIPSDRIIYIINPDKIKVLKGKNVNLPREVMVVLNSGAKVYKDVKWKYEKIDTNILGEKQIEGRVLGTNDIVIQKILVYNETPLNFDKLEEALDKVKSINRSEFSKSSIEVLDYAVKIAEEIKKLPNSQNEIDYAVNRINEALNELEKINTSSGPDEIKITNIVPNQNRNVSAGEKVEISFNAEQGKKASYQIIVSGTEIDDDFNSTMSYENGKYKADWNIPTNTNGSFDIYVKYESKDGKELIKKVPGKINIIQKFKVKYILQNENGTNEERQEIVERGKNPKLIPNSNKEGYNILWKLSGKSVVPSTTKVRKDLTFIAEYLKIPEQWANITFRSEGELEFVQDAKTTYDVLKSKTLKEQGVVVPQFASISDGKKVVWDETINLDENLSTDRIFTAKLVKDEEQYIKYIIELNGNGKLKDNKKNTLEVLKKLDKEKVKNQIKNLVFPDENYIIDLVVLNDEGKNAIVNFKKDPEKWVDIKINHTEHGKLKYKAQDRNIIDLNVLKSALEGDGNLFKVIDNNSTKEISEKLKNLEVEVLSDKGYKFDGWNKNDENTYTASFVKNQAEWRTVTFESDENGTLEGQTKFDVLIGTLWSTIVIPKYTPNEGYKFEKWSPVLPSSDDMINQNIVYRAGFIKKESKYIVKYHQVDESGNEYRDVNGNPIDIIKPKVVSGYYGDIINVKADELSNFDLLGDSSKTINLGDDEQEIIFKYTSKTPSESVAKEHMAGQTKENIAKIKSKDPNISFSFDEKTRTIYFNFREPSKPAVESLLNALNGSGIFEQIAKVEDMQSVTFGDAKIDFYKTDGNRKNSSDIKNEMLSNVENILKAFELEKFFGNNEMENLNSIFVARFHGVNSKPIVLGKYTIENENLYFEDEYKFMFRVEDRDVIFNSVDNAKFIESKDSNTEVESISLKKPYKEELKNIPELKVKEGYKLDGYRVRYTSYDTNVPTVKEEVISVDKINDIKVEDKMSIQPIVSIDENKKISYTIEYYYDNEVTARKVIKKSVLTAQPYVTGVDDFIEEGYILDLGKSTKVSVDNKFIVSENNNKIIRRYKKVDEKWATVTFKTGGLITNDIPDIKVLKGHSINKNIENINPRYVQDSIIGWTKNGDNKIYTNEEISKLIVSNDTVFKIKVRRNINVEFKKVFFVLPSTVDNVNIDINSNNNFKFVVEKEDIINKIDVKYVLDDNFIPIELLPMENEKDVSVRVNDNLKHKVTFKVYFGGTIEGKKEKIIYVYSNYTLKRQGINIPTIDLEEGVSYADENNIWNPAIDKDSIINKDTIYEANLDAGETEIKMNSGENGRLEEGLESTIRVKRGIKWKEILPKVIANEGWKFVKWDGFGDEEIVTNKTYDLIAIYRKIDYSIPKVTDLGITYYSDKYGKKDKTNARVVGSSNGAFYVYIPKDKYVDMNSARLTFNMPVKLQETKLETLKGNIYASSVNNDGLSGTILMKEIPEINLKVKSDDGINWKPINNSVNIPKGISIAETQILFNKFYGADKKNMFVVSGIAKSDANKHTEEYEIDSTNHDSELVIQIYPRKLKKVKINYYLGSSVYETVLVPQNGKPILPNDVKIAGLNFEGWYYDSEFNHKFDEGKEINHDISIYGKTSLKENTNFLWYKGKENLNEYELNTIEDFIGFISLVNGSNKEYGKINFKNKTVKLNSNLDFKKADISTIDGFLGTFDGKNHTISNVEFSNWGAYTGLFKTITTNATIKNIKIKTAKVSLNDDSGILVGRLTGGVIRNCHINDADVKSTQRAGILCGTVNSGLIEECSVKESQISGTQKIAGISGYLSGGKVYNCYVLDTQITNAWLDSATVLGYSKNTDAKYLYSNDKTIVPFRGPKDRTTFLANPDKNKSTYTNKGFSESIWKFTDGKYPTLLGEEIPR